MRRLGEKGRGVAVEISLIIAAGTWNAGTGAWTRDLTALLGRPNREQRRRHPHHRRALGPSPQFSARCARRKPMSDSRSRGAVRNASRPRYPTPALVKRGEGGVTCFCARCGQPGSPSRLEFAATGTCDWPRAARATAGPSRQTHCLAVLSAATRWLRIAMSFRAERSDCPNDLQI